MTHEEALAEALRWAKSASKAETWNDKSSDTIRTYALISQAWSAIACEIRNRPVVGVLH